VARGAGERTSARAYWYAEVKDWQVEAVPLAAHKASTACTAAFGKSCRGSGHAPMFLNDPYNLNGNL
jgi:hypothetical protein